MKITKQKIGGCQMERNIEVKPAPEPPAVQPWMEAAKLYLAALAAHRPLTLGQAWRKAKKSSKI